MAVFKTFVLVGVALGTIVIAPSVQSAVARRDIGRGGFEEPAAVWGGVAGAIIPVPVPHSAFVWRGERGLGAHDFHFITAHLPAGTPPPLANHVDDTASKFMLCVSSNKPPHRHFAAAIAVEHVRAAATAIGDGTSTGTAMVNSVFTLDHAIVFSDFQAVGANMAAVGGGGGPPANMQELANVQVGSGFWRREAELDLQAEVISDMSADAAAGGGAIGYFGFVVTAADDSGTMICH